MRDPAGVPLTFHLITHTHWDREWYLPRHGFLPRLVHSVGDVLDLLERDAAARFVLDGQTVLIEDVLGVRPDWSGRVAADVASGRLEIGPWYILADEVIPAGESLIRNLLQGTRDAARFGRRMNVLYSPDAFGHPAILPTLAREFGIDAGVTWRGLDDRPGRGHDLLVWRGPDGAPLLLYHLPPQGYEIGAALTGDGALVPERWRAIREQLVARAATSEVAVFVGADHHAPPHDAGAIRRRLQALEPGHHVQLSTLEEYFAAVRRALSADAAGRKLADCTGELRWSYGYTWTLQGVHGTRARLKRRHAAAELLLQRMAEVVAALASWHRGLDQSALIQSAWRVLLQCQFHDTLAGCCSDVVAREQESRLAGVSALSREMVRTSLHALARHDPDLAREWAGHLTPTLLLWNPVPRTRQGVVVAELTFFRRDAPVGPPGGSDSRAGGGFVPFTLVDSRGGTIPVQVLRIAAGQERLDAARHYPDQDEVDRVLCAFEAPAVPGLGLAAFSTRARDSRPASEHVEARIGRIANRFLEVRIGSDGRVDLSDRRTGERYPDVLRLIDEPDLGDSYTPWVPPDSPTAASVTGARQRVIANGPLVAAIEITGEMRSARRGTVACRVVLIAFADSPVLRVRLELDNQARDHRLRLRMPVGAGDSAMAGAAFGHESREPIDAPAGAFPGEQPLPTAPAHRYVAAGAADRGLAVLSPGFFEYEWTSQRELIITMQRAIGDLSRSTLPTRPGHAGWPMTTPDAQEIGRHEIELAVVPLGENEVEDVAALELLWEETFLPLQSRFLRDFAGSPDALDGIGITLEGEGLIFTALKPAESGRGVVLRCYNCENAPIDGRWIFRTAIEGADSIRADESRIEAIDLTDRHVIPFRAPARSIVSFLILPGE